LPESAGEPPKRLVGWSKVWLKPGESKDVSVKVVEKYLSVYEEASGWKLVPGSYTFMAGGSSADLPLKQSVNLK
jgi:beta-glucosidase